MEIMDVDMKIVSDDIRIRPKDSEVERLWSSNDKIVELLNWMPAFSGIDGFKKG